MGYATGSTQEYDEGNTAKTAVPTVGHTWVIIIGALALLWLFGGIVFRSVRM
jgi:amino acid transporter